MSFFPLFIDLEGRTALVVGGGVVAERRIGKLLEFGCRIIAVSPEVTADLRARAAAGEIVWLEKKYETADLQRGPRGTGFIFVLTAAGDGSVNERVARDCRLAGIPVNDASKKERCDFYFPGTVKTDGLVIGVTAEGCDHRRAAEVTRALGSFVRETWKA